MSGATLESLQAVAGPVSRETLERLRTFEAAFRKWSTRINLASPATLSDLWRRHVLDSAQVLPLSEAARCWLDLGSGGGFPGAVIAILLADVPDARVDIVESNHKKAAFLATSLAGIGAPARVHPLRIEDASGAVAMPEIVTARALAPLDALLALAEPWLSAGARGLFHKGRDYRREIEESVPGWEYDLVEHPSAVEDGAVILDISRLRRRAK